MANKIRIWVKQEKRIIKLLYQKGLLVDFDINDLYWAEFHKLRIRKKKHGQKYKGIIYLPELHYCTVDYFGEADEHSVVRYILDEFYWGNAELKEWQSDGEWPISSFKYRGRNWFIKYLERLPTVKAGSKVNKLLYMTYS